MATPCAAGPAGRERRYREGGSSSEEKRDGALRVPAFTTEKWRCRSHTMTGDQAARRAGRFRRAPTPTSQRSCAIRQADTGRGRAATSRRSPTHAATPAAVARAGIRRADVRWRCCMSASVRRRAERGRRGGPGWAQPGGSPAGRTARTATPQCGPASPGCVRCSSRTAGLRLPGSLISPRASGAAPDPGARNAAERLPGSGTGVKAGGAGKGRRRGRPRRGAIGPHVQA
jgi:hypothetical protein